jgi:putative methionine-R-sulfoxide reductase with GAF domain
MCANWTTTSPAISKRAPTRSEIVVLIRHPDTGKILGQIDVDGTEVGAFDESDEALLEVVGERIARLVLAHGI